ncbi:Aldolase-type TIM barrel [Phytophthora cactorum]|nr:Aldolase-type TIM barrel [Phytophthora cactorum]
MAAVTADYKLFTPLKLGDDLELKNRIVFGPLSRGRANADACLRKTTRFTTSSARATAISEQGYGWYNAAACYTDAHVEGWKRVTERVHKKGGKIFLQIHSSFNPKGEIVSASALRLERGTRDYETPRALETDEIPGVVESYRHGAELALKAGFDGYGGSFENRARLLMEIVEAVKTAVPSHRIGVRLAPNGAFAGMGSEDNYEMFKYTMERLSTYAKTAFKGIVMANNNYTRDRAEGRFVPERWTWWVSDGCTSRTRPGRALPERLALEPEAGHEVYYNSTLGGKGYNDFPAYS